MFLFFDNQNYLDQLKPLTFTRSILSIRIGIRTLKEQWDDFLENKNKLGEFTYILSSILPTKSIVEEILNLKIGECLFSENEILAYKIAEKQPKEAAIIEDFLKKKKVKDVKILSHWWDIFLNNDWMLRQEFEKLKQKNIISDSNTIIYNQENISIGENVEMKSAILNAEKGPIFIGNNVTIGEGAILIGPVAICENSVISMRAQIRPNVTIGPFCKIGGEVSQSIIFGYSNKSHEGFMGNSVIGEWCNWGAGTNNSNLKNDYGLVKVYDFLTQRRKNTQLQFCGVCMGDYSKTAIGTQLNTGTVVGVSCNVFGAGLSPVFFPNFSWGYEKKNYAFEKAIEVIQRTMERRNCVLTEAKKEDLYKII